VKSGKSTREILQEQMPAIIPCVGLVGEEHIEHGCVSCRILSNSPKDDPRGSRLGTGLLARRRL
jgi:hypothetical protein